MQIKTEDIHLSNQNVKRFTITNNNGMEICCLNLGGVITNISVPDRDNKYENVVLGFRDLHDYLTNNVYFGALIGRVAGRIQDAKFSLEDQTYTLQANDGDNSLHGGEHGLHAVLWDVTPFETATEAGLKLAHFSPDGEGGYPGNLHVQVTYTLNDNNEFSISYEAVSDQKTALTLTNHSYFNLSGSLKHDIQEHQVTLDSSKFVELDGDLIPTGQQLAVDGTVFDFRNGRPVMDGVTSDHEQNIFAGNGYDHYFIFDHANKTQAFVKDERSGRTLAVTTDQPGVVMYTSNSLDETLTLQEGSSKKYLGLCLETQSSPASLHNEGFPSVVLDKGEKYTTKTTFAFGTF